MPICSFIEISLVSSSKMEKILDWSMSSMILFLVSIAQTLINCLWIRGAVNLLFLRTFSLTYSLLFAWNYKSSIKFPAFSQSSNSSCPRKGNPFKSKNLTHLNSKAVFLFLYICVISQNNIDEHNQLSQHDRKMLSYSASNPWNQWKQMHLLHSRC